MKTSSLRLLSVEAAQVSLPSSWPSQIQIAQFLVQRGFLFSSEQQWVLFVVELCQFVQREVSSPAELGNLRRVRVCRPKAPSRSRGSTSASIKQEIELQPRGC